MKEFVEVVRGLGGVIKSDNTTQRRTKITCSVCTHDTNENDRAIHDT